MAEDSNNGSVRAAPRRARKDPNEAPVFLQKTFQMVDTCPDDIGGWSENGDTFIVKDMEAFANLLPKFFKHKNFRSFVRQLNFYGFRKLRTDGALISERPAHWWEFRHEKFMKGKVEWLTQIKRANHYEQSPSDQVRRAAVDPTFPSSPTTPPGRGPTLVAPSPRPPPPLFNSPP
mmetsp:Transcript_76601/g.219779  ORF Transcript_76601/g.219779 Transcript_76601/m.219779 type:complete len:175 (-) Transcript_76601:13-537(-)